MTSNFPSESWRDDSHYERQTMGHDDTTHEQQRPGLGRSAAMLTHDIVSLIELQSKLVAMDFKSAQRRSLTALAALGLAGAIALASFAGLIVGIGWWIAEAFSFSPGVTITCVALVGVVKAMAFGIYGWKHATGLSGAFDRSRAELQESLHALKQAMRGAADAHDHY